jgi:hypothetical protein
MMLIYMYDLFLNVYYNHRHVDDVDLYVGAISERILQLQARR